MRILTRGICSLTDGLVIGFNEVCPQAFLMLFIPLASRRPFIVRKLALDPTHPQEEENRELGTTNIWVLRTPRRAQGPWYYKHLGPADPEERTETLVTI